MSLAHSPEIPYEPQQTPLQRATDPEQYDRFDLIWDKMGERNSVRSQFFLHYLKPYIATWADKSVLDIGAGTGWLLQEALDQGALVAVGIDPSSKNVHRGQELYPSCTLLQTTLEAMPTLPLQFDSIVSVMAFPHIADLDFAMKKLARITHTTSKLTIIVPDFNYYRTSVPGRVVSIQELDEDSYVASVQRPDYGEIADIVRSTALHERAAKAAGFRLTDDIGMPPTEAQIVQTPRFAEYRTTPITRLLAFQRI